MNTPPFPIVRVWRGEVPVHRADAYHDYLMQTGIGDYERTQGNLGVLLLRQEKGELVNFTILTFWDSEASIRAFAGEAYEKARYYPEDGEFLVEMEEKVNHYDLVYHTWSLPDQK